MKRTSCTLLSVALALCARIVKAQAQGNRPPPNGYVPDAKTAIRIAVAVWSPIYGEKQIQSEKPFHASLKHGVWTVTGSLPGPPTVGGTALADISKQDGRVLLVFHTK